MNKERYKAMRSLNLLKTSIERKLSQFKKGNNPINNQKMLGALLLASLITTLAGLANAQSAGQSQGRWAVSI